MAVRPPTRAEFLQGSFAAGVGLAAVGRAAAQGRAAPPAYGMRARPIPSSGESLPVVGCGTWQTFDLAPADRAPLAETLRVLFEAGGSVIDSSPMYGRSEEAVGDVLTRIGFHDRAFLATKVWTTGQQAGIRQMQASMRLLRDPVIDLMQVHNLVDVEVQLATLAAWKREGRIRYIGVTHYTASAHAALEAVMRRHRPDFVQLDYSAEGREVEARLLPAATDLGTAVIVNQPFGGGGLLRRMAGKPLPGFAAEIGCTSWAQLLLKFLLGHPAVTCVIPGTGRPEHMLDNVRAGFGVLPDAGLRERIAAAIA